MNDGRHFVQGGPGGVDPQGIREQAQAAHSGIDLEVHRKHFAAAAGHGIQCACRRKPPDALDQVVGDEIFGKGRIGRAEDQDRGLEAGLTQANAFVDAGHGQHVGAGGQNRAGHLEHAVAVAVGLDHGYHPGLGASDAPQLPHIVGDGGEVDLGPDVGECRRL